MQLSLLDVGLERDDPLFRMKQDKTDTNLLNPVFLPLSLMQGYFYNSVRAVNKRIC